MKRRGKVSLAETEAELVSSLWLCNVVVCDVHSAVIIKHSFPLLTSHYFLHHQRKNLSLSKLTSRPKRWGNMEQNTFKHLQTVKLTLGWEIEKVSSRQVGFRRDHHSHPPASLIRVLIVLKSHTCWLPTHLLALRRLESPRCSWKNLLFCMAINMLMNSFALFLQMHSSASQGSVGSFLVKHYIIEAAAENRVRVFHHVL